MPFAEKEFDFTYCSHVLEHVADPAAACREIMRISKRGYIECPRSWVEYAFHAVDHRWLVDHERHVLIFREKLEEEKRDLLGIQYAIFTWLNDHGFRGHWDSPEIKAVRNVEFYWERKFDFQVIAKHERKNGGAYEQIYRPSNSPLSHGKLAEQRSLIYSEFLRIHGAKNVSS
jgi:ubiquinone/menaquinone biosynthesis C-methylase UbiE